MKNGLIATYQVIVSSEKTDEVSLQKLARHIAIGQTIGTEKAEELEALQPYLAKVVSVSKADPAVLIRIAFPFETIQSDIGALLAVIFGKLSMAGKIRLVDLEMWQPLCERFASPR